jgi:acyl-CoA thioesterase FadM
MAEALVQIACLRRADGRPAPIPGEYMERMQT